MFLSSPIQASIRFLPAPVAGTAANVVVGLHVLRTTANYLVWGGSALAALAPQVMVFAGVHSNYWSTAFLAKCFNAIGADALFTVAIPLITSVFPAKTQALAGGVFNTVS
ncbi:hypothetical protein EJ03DRAFT_348468 [Teratosphaeria nubilosa]|uniref:Major facilitator superfamily (MFS) profile domain-containing protein n=1 Tax=Teratosphaeria nubilosa TaxID=161662 RepID=A0A6G1LHZ1_9PEZI|nr:hypothetical protein EJ03DRAFT_348468 [Teratosphaeria nubilosa]